MKLLEYSEGTPKRSVVIIGAGVSGLAAALTIAEQSRGTSITILEARRSVGGRTRSFQEVTTGDVIDNGQHLLLGCYTATLNYLQQIGTLNRLRREPLMIDYFDRGQTSTLRAGGSRIAMIRGLLGSGQPGSSLLGSGTLQSRFLSLSDSLRAVQLLLSSGKIDASETALEWLQRKRQSDAVIRKLWEPMVLATMNCQVHLASALIFREVLSLAFLGGGRSGDLLFASVGLSELLIDPAIAKLQAAGAVIELGATVHSIQRTGDGFLVEAAAKEYKVDAVILACDASHINLPEFVQNIPAVKYSPIISGYFWIDRVILHRPINALLGTSLHWVFPKPTSYAAQLLALTASAADAIIDKSAEELRDQFAQELRDATNQNFRIMHYQIVKEKRATPILTPLLESQRPGVLLSRGLFLAGDLAKNRLPFTIEGAIRNGITAAKAALQNTSYD